MFSLLKKGLKMLTKKQQGYSLVELSIATSIAAMLAVSGLAIVQKKNAADKEKVTKTNLKAITIALESFITTNKYIPCPALPGLTESNTNFGKSENISGQSYTQIYDPITGSCTNGLTSGAGMVPVRTLGLADEYAYDGWQRKLTYVTAMGSGNKNDFTKPTFKGDISILDLHGNEKTHINDSSTYQEGATYVIISHGANGYNIAWSKNSTTPPPVTGLEGPEAQNTNHSSRKYIQDEATTVFDDIVAYGMPYNSSQRIPQAPFAISPPACTYANHLAQRTGLEDYAGANATYAAHTEHIYRISGILQQLCKNPPSVPSACDATGICFYGMTLWLDATDPTGDGITQPANNTDVASWQDKSGKKFHMAQSVPSSKPKYILNAMNSKPVVRFDGTSDFLSYTTLSLTNLISTDAYTIYAVFKATNVNNANGTELRKNDSVLGDGTGRIGLALRSIGGGSAEAYHFNWDGNEDIAKKTFTIGTPLMVTLIHDPSDNIIIYKNSDTGVTTASSDTLTFSGLFVGKNSYTNYFNGDIAEILVYNRQLSADELTAVDTYLATKWGITLE